MTSRIVKATIGGTTKTVNASPYPATVLAGPSQTYLASPYSAWDGMWGSNRAFTCSLNIVPARFPAGTRFAWNIDPTNYAGLVNGYFFTAYGNYDDSPGSITPRQVKNITTLSATIGWTLTGDPSGGLLSELWLSPAAAATGPVSKTYEVAFMPYLGSEVSAWVAGLSAVGSGSFVDGNGVTWNVAHTGGGQDYFVAYRPGYASFQGVLPFRDYLTFLQASGMITGNEWINGLAFGVEPRRGAATLTVDQFSVAYAGTP